MTGSWKVKPPLEKDPESMTPDEVEILRAVDQWRQKNRRYASISVIIAIMKSLGWRKND